MERALRRSRIGGLIGAYGGHGLGNRPRPPSSTLPPGRAGTSANPLSILFFVPRAARLQAHELVISTERVIRERQPDDPPCTKLALCALEGELFFGAAPELDELFGELTRRVERETRIIVLRLKRIRNPHMVCLERIQHFLEDMESRGVPVLLCGVRPDLAQVLKKVKFHHWMPRENLFLEEPTAGSSTLHAVRRA